MVEGICILCYVLCFEEVVIVIEDNKLKVIKVVKKVLKGVNDMFVCEILIKYLFGVSD